MLFGFEFAIGMMLAFVVVPALIWLFFVAFKIFSRSVIAKSVAALMLGALWIAWIFTH